MPSSKFVDFADGLLPQKGKKAVRSPNKASTHHDEDDMGEELVRNMLLDLQSLEVKNPYKAELRCSGLPFCPIRSLLKDSRDISYRMEHYTETGTAIHSTLQKWTSLGKYGNRLWGNWKCSACGEVKHKHCHRPKEACDCRANQQEWYYDEIDIAYKHLTGHIDTIFYIGNGQYVVIDYKTTYMEKKKRSPFFKADKPSSKNYILQVRTYCALLRELFGMNIVGWYLVSVDRSEPISGPEQFWLLSGEWNDKFQDKWLDRLDEASDNFVRLQRLNAAIDKNDKKLARKRLIAMVKNRPCKSKADYSKWMEFGFFGKDKCELLGDCCTSDRAAFDRVIQELK